MLATPWLPALVVVLFVGIGYAACPAKPAGDVRPHRAANPDNRRLIDSGIRQLLTGDVVLRTGADVTSYMFSQMNQRNKTYSHCGIVVVEDGYPFVYHCIGGEDNPDEKLRRDSANFWFSPVYNLGYGVVRFPFDSAELQQVVALARQYYREERRFDMSFDLATDDQLYCAEFLYKLLNRATENDSFIKPSYLFGESFVGVDNLFLNEQAQFIWQVRYK